MTVRPLLLAALAAPALVSLAGAAQATSYNFSLAGQAAGTTLPLSLTSNGVTATFSAPAGNAFTVGTTPGLFTFAPFLLDNSFFSASPLTISFSAPITGQIAIPVALTDSYAANDTVAITTNNGGNFSFAARPDGLPLGEPEIYASFLASGVTSLTISDLSPSQGGPVSLAIGGVQVPEPATLTLLGAGLLGLAARRRR